MLDDCVCVRLLQMVVVSDDVHEYAVALKDTEEKISRCPGRVRRSQWAVIHQAGCTICEFSHKFPVLGLTWKRNMFQWRKVCSFQNYILVGNIKSSACVESSLTATCTVCKWHTQGHCTTLCAESRHSGGAAKEPEGVCWEAQPPEPQVGLDQHHHLLQGTATEWERERESILFLLLF